METIPSRVVACLLLCLSCAPVASAQSAAQPLDAAQPPVVVTTGEGIVQAVPDRAWITIAAESRAPNPGEAQRRNTAAMQPVLDKLRAAGVPDEAIRTVAYDLQQEWDYVEGRRISRGYLARNAVEVRVDPLDRLSGLLEIAVGTGATQVGDLRFDLKDRAAHEREALRLAVADARARADAAAAGIGRTVDRVLRVEELGTSMPPPRPLMREAAQFAQADAAPPISAGQIELRAQVTVTSALR